MNRRDMMKVTAGAMVVPLAGFTASNRVEASAPGEMKERICMKKYTNADYYKNGVFQKDVAFRAFYEMFEDYGYTLADKLRTFKNGEFWVVDFGLGDFENVGMGGIIWYNSKETGYFGHDIYLLPHQMIAEHFHLPAENYKAKHETWLVRDGSIFNFGKGGELTDEVKAMLPKSQLDAGAITCFNFEELHVGEVRSLNALEEPHFMMAGEKGAIVTEFGSYHSMAGLGFTNKGAALG